jgi:hypothetical protein
MKSLESLGAGSSSVEADLKLPVLACSASAQVIKRLIRTLLKYAMGTTE